MRQAVDPKADESSPYLLKDDTIAGGGRRSQEDWDTPDPIQQDHVGLAPHPTDAGQGVTLRSAICRCTAARDRRSQELRLQHSPEEQYGHSPNLNSRKHFHYGSLYSVLLAFKLN
jgi:hypothetical protein